MPRPNSVLVVFLAWLSVVLPSTRAQNGCGTDQNPYCAGNSVLEQLCCPYPNVCYWQNRDGEPGCCPAGQVCDGSSPYYPPTTPVPTTTVHPSTITITPTPTPTLAPTTVTTNPGGGGVIIVTTVPNGGSTVTTTHDGHCDKACSTVTSYVGGAYSTVTSGVAGVYSTVTSGVAGVVSTVTSDAGVVFATVSGVLVGAAPSSSTVTVLAPFTAALVTLAWNYFGWEPMQSRSICDYWSSVPLWNVIGSVVFYRS